MRWGKCDGRIGMIYGEEQRMWKRKVPKGSVAKKEIDCEIDEHEFESVVKGSLYQFLLHTH